MEFIADVFLIAGALGAGFYCFVLSSRLRRFTDLEKGVGGAVAVLSAQVDDLKKSLDLAQQTADGSVGKLSDVSARAESAAKRLELLVSSIHDLPEQTRASEPDPTSPFFARKAVVRSAGK